MLKSLVDDMYTYLTRNYTKRLPLRIQVFLLRITEEGFSAKPF